MDRYYDHVCNEYKKVKCVATNLLLLMLCFRVRFDLLYFIIKAFPHLFLIHFKICVDNRCEKKNEQTPDRRRSWERTEEKSPSVKTALEKYDAAAIYVFSHSVRVYV